MGVLPIKLVAPITSWKEHFSKKLWHVRIDPAPSNGLTQVSAVDTLQLRGMDKARFLQRMGELSEEEMDAVVLALAAVVEFP